MEGTPSSPATFAGSQSAPASATPPCVAGPVPRKSGRSRDGCLTCKRRKVKCNEQRPRCSHCERLNLECKWRQQPAAAGRRRRPGAADAERQTASLSPATDDSPAVSSVQPLQAVDEVFDYARFMWDSGDFWPEAATMQNLGLEGQRLQMPLETAPLDSLVESNQGFPGRRPSVSAVLPVQAVPAANATGGGAGLAMSPAMSDELMEYFTQSVIPPILDEVATQKTWLAMRQAVVEMAKVSRMVKYAILAFSSVLLCRRSGPYVTGQQNNHYASAVAEVAECNFPLAEHSAEREQLLAALFFLSYVDILESRLEAAHSHLKRAHDVFQSGNKSSFVPREKQFLQWIRLLDGRAVSAGGEGLFLGTDEESVLVDASPATYDGEGHDAARDDVAENEIEDVLFQVLYQPGIVFYQKVQSFMGRISKIDPWHHPRGTVEDEIKVMNVGATIAADLRTLYDQRPPLMDYAIHGKLTPPHVSPQLAFVITRAFRTYMANYYASKIHLHRVAYKTLPLTREACEALDHIRQLTRRMVDDMDGDDALPVNMLWPLLMLGAEERDPEQRAWISAQILRMEKVASNARITARVLEEVQARQDAARMRMDIRSVMYAVFNSCFPIL